MYDNYPLEEEVRMRREMVMAKAMVDLNTCAFVLFRFKKAV